MEYDVFISYSRKDTAIVDQFVNRLTEAGYNVWIDRDGIYSGDQFKMKIIQAIKNSSIVIFVSSINSNTSQWTIKEISYAIKKGKTIIPVKIDDTEYDDNIDFDLVNIDFIQFNHNQSHSFFNQLTSSLDAHGCKRKNKPDFTPHPEELFSQGEAYYKNKDFEQAIKCFKLAAALGHINSQFFLGLCYMRRQGVEIDYNEAVKWLKLSAKQGHPYAQYYLGRCYYYGNGVEKNPQEAVKWYSKAAEQGNDNAQYELGLCLKYGLGCNQNYKEAIKWLIKSRKYNSFYALGECYNNLHDFQQAVKWYTKAALLFDEPNAEYKLGQCYENGQGVRQDLHEAVIWYRRAARQDNEDAIEALKRLNAR